MRNIELNDQELLNSYLEGNESALEALIKRHKQKVFTAIVMKVKDHSLAEDIFQETFIKAIETLRSGKYCEKGKFAPWVMCIAHNLCIDHFRKVKRTPGIVTTEGDDIFKILKFEDSMPEMHEEHEKLEKTLKELVEQLPDEQKEVLVLRIFYNFSFKEVAAYTHCNLSTCLGRMRYALLNLRKLMEAQKLTVRSFS